MQELLSSLKLEIYYNMMVSIGSKLEMVQF